MITTFRKDATDGESWREAMTDGTLPIPDYPYVSASEDGSNLPVFLQPWWLNAASSDHPSITVDATLSGRRAGRLVYTTRRNKIGGKLGFPPYWSHLGGPVLEPGLSSREARDASRQIASQLPRNISYRFACDPNAQHFDEICTEFGDQGFSVEYDPTYLVHPDDGDILDRLKSRHRAQIKSAGRRTAIVNGDAERFIDFYKANLQTRTHSPISTARHIIEAGIRRNQLCIFLALKGPAADIDGQIDAAIACAWDRSRYYYWMSHRRSTGDAAEKCNPEATKLLILHAIDHARSLGLTFDADSPESAGGRAVFNTIFGITRIEQRPVLIRKSRITRAYDRAVPIIKRVIRRAYPDAPIYDPRSTL